MHTTVNIGLKKNTGGKLSPTHALAVLRAIGGVKAILAEVFESDSEPTLVAVVDRQLYASAAYEVAEALSQDCIAYHDGRDGDLVGPNAAAWGAFNPEYFLDIHGERLA